ncbi:MAG: MBL fold metallo-hydrolase [Elainella sp. Prado103]|jgi:L-ascorbate metabolism protein UlaG (beta-lactamase superfamily)|nr:MBL fold metallo-hydrolase [Elainella sp. Prado103]
MHLTWLDSNSWLIEMGNQKILLDPWLVGPLVFGNLPWLFKGTRTIEKPIPSAIDLILLSQGLEDHAHPATLQQLDHQIPVIGSPNAAKVVQQLGFTQVTALSHGDSTTIGDLTIHAVPGSPIGPLLTENGYVLIDQTNQTKLYYEPHGNHSPTLRQFAPVDVVITPILDLEIPFVGSVIKGSQSAIELVEWLQPRAILPTAAGGDIEFAGVLLSVLRAKGGSAEFQQELARRQLKTQLLEPKPAERLNVNDVLAAVG